MALCRCRKSGHGGIFVGLDGGCRPMGVEVAAGRCVFPNFERKMPAGVRGNGIVHCGKRSLYKHVMQLLHCQGKDAERQVSHHFPCASDKYFAASEVVLEIGENTLDARAFPIQELFMRQK